MSAPLRAFFMLRHTCGDWKVEVFRDLEPLLKAWSSRSEEQATAVVHVGFSRSPSSAFEDCARSFPGRVLLTTSGKYSLPPAYQTSSNPLAEVDGQEVYLATKGWGYDASHLKIPPFARPLLNFTGWISEYVEVNPKDSDALLRAGILDDMSYQSNESGLSRELRTKLGIFRFNITIKNDRDNPCAWAQAAPPWLAEKEFGMLDATVRLSNIFKTNQIIKVADLETIKFSDLCGLKNFGKTTLNDLLGLLKKALDDGPIISEYSSDGECPIKTDITLLAAINRTLSLLSPRVGEVLKKRMGFDGPPQTLAEVGDSLGLTRERIRQIETKALQKLIVKESWDDLLAIKLRGLLTSRRFPLPLLGVEAVDSWFEGIGEYPEVIRYLLGNVLDGQISLLKVDEVDYFSFISPVQWEEMVKSATNLIAASVDNKYTEDSCKSMLGALLPENAIEFAALLWKKATERSVFVESGDERILLAHGRNAENVTLGILEESLDPLHYTEIAEKSKKYTTQGFDVRRAHGAANQVGILFGPGIFGLRKHLKLNAKEMDEFARSAEELIIDDGQDRQWHCDQILELLSERSPDSVPEGADKYHLDIALKDRGNLRRLGRLVWALPGVLSEANRLEVRKTVITLLRKAGSPLSEDEIKQRLCAIRGVSKNFQVLADDPLLKVGTKKWGLNDRDFSFKRDKQPLLFDEIVYTLKERGTGIHFSELIKCLDVSYDTNPHEIFSLSALDRRLAINMSQYLYLREWGGARRESMTDAVKVVMLQRPGLPLDIDTIVSLAESRIGRSIDKRCIYGALHSVGAKLVKASTWQFDLPADGLGEERECLDRSQ